MNAIVTVLNEVSIRERIFFVVRYDEQEFYVPKHQYQIDFNYHPSTIEVEEYESLSGERRLRQTYTSLLEGCYESGCSYDFTIVSKEMDGDAQFYKLSDCYGFTHRLYQNCIYTPIKDDSIGSEITCTVMSFQKNRLNLKYSEYERLEAIKQYQIGDVEEFRVSRIQVDSNNDCKFYMVVGKYGYTHRVYDHGHEHSVGEKIRCRVTGIDEEREILILGVVEEQAVSRPIIFFSVEEVSLQSGATDLKQHIELLDDNRYKNLKYVKDFKNNYATKQNHWIFSYLNFLSEDLIPKFLRGKEYQLAKEFCIEINQICRWILESNFLSFFHGDLKEKSILKSEYTIQAYEVMISAIDIILQKREEAFITQMVDAIESVGYVYEREKRLLTIASMQSAEPELFKLYQEPLIRIAKYVFVEWMGEHRKIDHDLAWSYRDIQKKIYLSARRRNGVVPTEEDLTAFLKILVLRVLVGQCIGDLEDLSKIKYQFYYTLYEYSRQPAMMILAMKAMCLSFDDSELFTWRMLNNFDINQACRKALEVTISSANSSYVFQNGAMLVISPDSISVFSKGHYHNGQTKLLSHASTVASAYNGQIRLCDGTSSYPLTTPKCAKELVERLSRYESNLDLASDESLPLPEVGEEVNVIVKEQDFSKFNGLIFVQIIDPDRKNISGILRCQESSKLFVNHFTSLMQPGTIFKAKVTNIETGDKKIKVQFSIEEYVAKYEKQCRTGDDAIRNYISSEGTILEQDYLELDKKSAQKIEEGIRVLFNEERDIETKIALSMIGKVSSAAVGSCMSFYFAQAFNFIKSAFLYIDGTMPLSISLPKSFGFAKYPLGDQCYAINEVLLKSFMGEYAPEDLTALWQTCSDETVSELSRYLLAEAALADDIDADPVLASSITSKLSNILIRFVTEMNLCVYYVRNSQTDIQDEDIDEDEDNELEGVASEDEIKPAAQPQEVITASQQQPSSVPSQLQIEKASIDIAAQKTLSEGILFYINFRKDGKYSLDDNVVNDEDVIGTLPVRESAKDDYIFICYSCGRVNKVRLNVYMDLVRGRIYKNGYYKDGGVQYACILPDSGVIVIDHTNGPKSQFKYVRCSSIEQRTTLQSHGMETTGPDVSYVNYYGLDNDKIALNGIPEGKIIVNTNYTSKIDWTPYVSAEIRDKYLLDVSKCVGANKEITEVRFFEPEYVAPLTSTETISDASVQGKPSVDKCGKSYFMHLKRDGGYILYDDSRIVEESILTVSFPHEPHGMSLLQCYDGGYINKYPLESIASKNIGIDYKNGRPKDTTPIAFMAGSETDFVVIMSVFNAKQYVKVVPVSAIKTKTALMLKGDRFMPYDTSFFTIKLVDDEFGVLAQFIDTDSESRGVEVSSSVGAIVNDFVEEFERKY